MVGRGGAEVRASVAAAALGLATESAGVWGRVVRGAGAASPILRAVLTNASLARVEGDEAVVTCSPRYLSGAQKMRGQIAEALSRELGREVRVDLRVAEEAHVAAGDGTGVSESSADTEQNATSANVMEQSRAAFNPNLAMENELVKQAMELFGGRIVDVRPR